MYLRPSASHSVVRGKFTERGASCLRLLAYTRTPPHPAPLPSLEDYLPGYCTCWTFAGLSMTVSTLCCHWHQFCGFIKSIFISTLGSPFPDSILCSGGESSGDSSCYSLASNTSCVDRKLIAAAIEACYPILKLSCGQPCVQPCLLLSWWDCLSTWPVTSPCPLVSWAVNLALTQLGGSRMVGWHPVSEGTACARLVCIS